MPLACLDTHRAGEQRPWSSAVYATWRQAPFCPSSSWAEPFLVRSGPLEQRRLRNMEAGILLASSPRAAKPPTLVVQPDNELVCARKLSAVLGGGCSPQQGLCLALLPQRGIPALMQRRGALDAVGPQLQGKDRRPMLGALGWCCSLKGRLCSTPMCWWDCNMVLGSCSQQSGLQAIAWQQVIMLASRGLGGTCCIKSATLCLLHIWCCSSG